MSEKKLLTLMCIRCECCNRLFDSNIPVTDKGNPQRDPLFGNTYGHEYYIGDHKIPSMEHINVGLVKPLKLSAGSRARFRAW